MVVPLAAYSSGRVSSQGLLPLKGSCLSSKARLSSAISTWSFLRSCSTAICSQSSRQRSFFSFLHFAASPPFKEIATKTNFYSTIDLWG